MAPKPLPLLSQEVAQLDLSDSNAQTRTLRRVRDLRVMISDDERSDCCDCLDAATMLLQRMIDDDEPDEGIVRIASGLISVVERVAEDSGDPEPAAPLPSTEAPRSSTLASGGTKPDPRASESGAPSKILHTVLLGETLVKMGFIAQEDVVACLAEQKKTGQRFGDVLVSRGLLTSRQVQLGLRRQAQIQVRGSGAAKLPRAPLPKRSAFRAPSGSSGERTASPLRMAGDGPSMRKINSVLLGEVLVQKGHLQRADLERALAAQRRKGWLLGEVLVKMGLVSREVVRGAVAAQARNR